MNKKDLRNAKPEDAQAWMRERVKRKWEETFPGEPYPCEAEPPVPTRTVWLNVSIEVDSEDFPDDESMMDYANELATGAGFIFDDMGMVNPSDMDKFYPIEEDK